jgi:hypothetical protein
MTATMMTMETKATAATCCCLRRRRRRRRQRPKLAAAATLASAPKLAAAYALPPRFRCRCRLWQDGRQRQRGQRTAQSLTTIASASVLVESTVDGGCEHYLPFHQPHSDDFMPDANHQQIWLIALPVAQPPPIRLVPLHPNTMGGVANVRFCQNHRWGQVIGGVLPM